MSPEESGKKTTNELVDVIADRGLKQKDIARLYSCALSIPCVDWYLVNRAILARYSMSGLQRIKDLAWKIHESGVG
jgi:hypothetical protein